MSHQTLRHRGPYGAGLEADLAAVRSSEAQTTKITNLPSEDLKTLQKEGDSFTFNAFTSRDAWELGHLLHARLVRDPRATLISISLANGQVLFQTTTGAVTPDNEIWVARKRKTVTRFGVSSWQFHVKFDSDEDRFAAKYGMSKEQASGYAIHGGGVPIRVEGVEGVVAVVIVSGLAQAEDHGVIVDVIKENWEPVA